jgi:hypothetical protein
MSADNNCWAVLLAVSENVSAKMSLGAAAEAYASENIAVFPLRRRTKLPATANGFKAAQRIPTQYGAGGAKTRTTTSAGARP